MRSSLSRAIAAMVGGLVVACASPTSPTPVTSPSQSSAPAASATSVPTGPPVVDPAPTPTGATSSGASEWPYYLGHSTHSVQVGPDGTAYVLTETQNFGPPTVVALDAGGRAKPGWPMQSREGFAIQALAVSADGFVYVAECGYNSEGCFVHRLDGTAQEQSGWPFDVPSDFACGGLDQSPPCTVGVDVAPDGTVWVNAFGHQKGGLDLIAIDMSGRLVPGWPVDMDDHQGWWSNLQIGADGTVFVVWRPVGRPDWGPEGRVTDDIVELWAFAPDGHPRAGWPASVPESGGYVLGPEGAVITVALVDLQGELCPGPERTVFSVLNPDGRTAPGWPRGSTGFSSGPSVSPDGTVYFVTALGNVYAYDRAGQLKAGWPAAVPGVLGGCTGATGAHLGPDGSVYVVGDAVTARSPDGSPRPGWPYRPAGELSFPCLDTECSPTAPHPVFGPDGTVYISVYGVDSVRAWYDVVALDPGGQVKSGWPVRLPINARTDYGPRLSVAPDGRLIVHSSFVLLSLDPDGRISQ